MKIVVNKCEDGFWLSEKAENMLAKMTNMNVYDFWAKKYRNHPALITVVEKLSKESYDEVSDLAIVEIPDTATDWDICIYDGIEEVIYVLDGKIHHA